MGLVGCVLDLKSTSGSIVDFDTDTDTDTDTDYFH
jgi:hypothetical protein